MPAETKIAGTSVAMESALLLTSNEGYSVQSNMTGQAAEGGEESDHTASVNVWQREKQRTRAVFYGTTKEGRKECTVSLVREPRAGCKRCFIQHLFSEISSWVIM